MRIIVVDDDKIIRNGLSKVISNLFDQHKVIGTFQNGKIAFDYLKDNNVDVVITDIKMPVMTGIELIKKATETLKNPPLFIVLSGYNEFSYVRDMMKLGAFNYLLKPLKKSALKEIMAEIEDKIAENNKNKSILNKSLRILRKDFFQKALFESLNKEYFENDDLEAIGLNKNTFYKLIVFKVYSKNKDYTLERFLENILNEDYISDYVLLENNDSIYLILFYNQDNRVEENNAKINKSLDYFINENRSIISSDVINTINELKSKKKIIDDIKENIYLQKKASIFFIKEDIEVNNFLKNEDQDYNTIAIKISKEYIMNNFTSNIKLKDLSNKVFLSQNYLSELFKKETGEGFYEFLSKCRVEKAKQILLTTNLRVYEVGKKVGYNDPITFGRAFKKITGTTPNKFRNNHSYHY